MKVFKYKCGICGNQHEGSPSFTYRWPHEYEILSKKQREELARISNDLCIIENEDHFIKVNLEIPIQGYDKGFLWGVWISVSKENFQKYYENYNSKNYQDTYMGWFSNRLPYYPDTLDLKSRANIKSDGRRPLIDLEPTEHPLSIDSYNGISWERAAEIAQVALHQSKV